MNKTGFLTKVEVIYGKIALVLAFFMGSLHIVNTSGLITLSSTDLRLIHLMGMMALVYLSPKKNKDSSNTKIIIRFVLLIVEVACSLYALFVIWPVMIKTGGSTSTVDAIVGLLMVIVLLETCRRYMAPALSIVALIFLLYPFVCNYLPGVLHGRTYSFTRVLTAMFASTNGIYGIPLGVSSTYIVMFGMFGAFLQNFGASDFLFNFAAAATRGLVGATAKTSIVSSMLIGMITGSPAGNVAITGSITIPMMKNKGYDKVKAAAYESVASTGGAIMPPVMGSAAFLMAEITGTPYVEIAKAAFLPATLYFLSIYLVSHYDCKRYNIDCVYIPSPDDKSTWQIVKEGWFFSTPIVAMILLLLVGYSPLKSALYSGIALVIMYIIHTMRLDKGLIRKIIETIQMGATNTCTMAITCATAGIIIGILSMTGLGSRFSILIVEISRGNLLLTLFLVMITGLILGMGLPTSASYLVLSTVAVPALLELGLPVIGSHLFVLFFACISAITPPVALASYTAAGIADADLNDVGITAFRFGIVSFILPFIFVSSPALLFDGQWYEIIQVAVMAIFGVTCLSMANVGFSRILLKVWERIALFVAGLLMIETSILTDIIGLVIALGTYMISRKRQSSKTSY